MTNQLPPSLQRFAAAFDTAVYAELTQTPARADRPCSPRARRVRPRVLAGTTLGLAGLGTALVIALGTSATSPAFAVTRHHDGTVFVTINRRSGIAGANRRLAAMGIHERVFAIGDDLGKSIPVVQQPSNATPLVLALGEKASGAPHEPVCLITKPGQPAMSYAFLSVAQARAEITGRSFTGSDPYHVDACYAFTGPPTSGNTR